MSRNACARFVFIRTIARTALRCLSNSSVTVRLRADAARRAGDQNGIYHVLSS